MYDEEYYKSNLGVSCEHRQHWERFFDNVARGIVGEYNPRTVLDAGCALGFLVEALRKLGVEAYGIDISEYAISQASPAIKNYVTVGDITADLPNGDRFDVITCIEVLEHLTPSSGEQAIENITGNTDVVLFSSTPDDKDEPTHVNVQPFTYWWRLFNENGFAVNVTKTAAFVNQHAAWFERWQRLGTLS